MVKYLCERKDGVWTLTTTRRICETEAVAFIRARAGEAHESQYLKDLGTKKDIKYYHQQETP